MEFPEPDLQRIREKVAERNRAEREFRRIKPFIQKKYNYCCANCKKNTNTQMEIHHRDVNRLNNNEENLVLLCKKCHGEAHREFGILV